MNLKSTEKQEIINFVSFFKKYPCFLILRVDLWYLSIFSVNKINENIKKLPATDSCPLRLFNLSAIIILNFLISMDGYQLLASFTYCHSFSLLKRLTNIICLPWISKNMDIFEENYKIDNFLFFGGLQVHWPAFNCRKYLISPSVMMHYLNRECKYLSSNIRLFPYFTWPWK